MSHHGTNPRYGSAGIEGMEMLRQEQDKINGTFPKGKLGADDQGAIALGVAVMDGRVVVRFPEPVSWFGMTGDEAAAFADVLLKRAKEAGISESA